MTASPVLAAETWPTNGHLIADVARLYLRPDDLVLDPTWGRGKWWTRYQPARLIRHDLHTLDGVDFRNLPEANGSFDVVAFDPPYVAMGGRTTSGLGQMMDAYGMRDAPATPQQLWKVIVDGLDEINRVLKPRGLLLMKCQDYVWSGRLQPVTYWAIDMQAFYDCELVDRFEHVTKPRPQPTTNRDGTPRRQVHARRNLSTLLVFRKACS